jgi:tetratricopeptide (TPR) repeat protein
MSDSDKNYNLELSLAESYTALSTPMQTCFRALGVFALEGSFDQAAAQSRWQMPDPYQAEDTLTALVKLALVRQSEGGRCHLHSLLRDYARALAPSARARADCQRRHFEHYQARYANHDKNNDEDTHPALALDWENIRTALEWGLGQQVQATAAWLVALQYFMDLRRTGAERLALLEANLPQTRAAEDRLGEAHCLKALGEVHYMQDDYGAAVERYQQALVLGQQIGNFTSQLNRLMGLARTYRAQGQPKQACAFAQQFLALAASHPFFKDHPLTERQRQDFAGWGC